MMTKGILIDIFIFLVAIGGTIWYVNSQHVKQTSNQETKVPAQNINKQKNFQDPRVKILTAPQGTPSTMHTTSGGFVMDPRKLVIFPAVRGKAASNQWKQEINKLVEKNNLDDYYVVRFADVPSSISCRAPLPWVLEHCRSMCIVKDNKLLQVQGNSISDQDVKEILQKYKNWQ